MKKKKQNQGHPNGPKQRDNTGKSVNGQSPGWSMLDAIGIKKLESLTDINKKVAEEEKRLKTL